MNVFQRFSKVQASMSKIGIDKSGKNKQQGYAYRGIDQVMNTVGPILAEHEVLIMPSVLNHHMTQGTTKNGGVSFHHTVEVEYLITGPEGDHMGPFKSRGECIDTSDKGLNKACTAAFKYWVLTALCIPTEASDDADNETPDAPDVNQPEILMTDDERKEILGLCMQSNTNVEEFTTWLGYARLIEVPQREHARAKKALEQKLHKMNEDYAQGERP